MKDARERAREIVDKLLRDVQALTHGDVLTTLETRVNEAHDAIAAALDTARGDHRQSARPEGERSGGAV